MYIDKYSDLWKHTKKRIDEAEAKATKDGKLDTEKFTSQMLTRLQRITREDKLYYAIAYLKQKGYNDLVDSYDGKILINKMLEDL